MFKREIFFTLLARLREPRRFIQVVTGPRQVGKTTMVLQVAKELHVQTLYASADEPTLKNPLWIEQQWEQARLEMKASKLPEFTLILDEIQKITGWSDLVKRLWDEDTKNHLNLKLVLLGSAPLLVQQGLSDSLMGRFEQIPATHWTFSEMQEAFNYSLEQYIYFGGYPGAAGLIEDESRWQRYVLDSLIETTLSRDILLLNRIHKPALLRNLFYLATQYSSQILSYQKMVGQLQDAGNTTTLAHYLELLKSTSMIAGLSKFSGDYIHQRDSSPKLQVFNTALISAQIDFSYLEAQKDRAYWGRLVESAIGAYLLNSCINKQIDLYYWRDRGKEVDFVLKQGKKIIAFEVKSGPLKEEQTGLVAFCQQYKQAKSFIVGSQSLSIESFLSTPLEHWF